MVAEFLKGTINIVCEPILQAHDSQIFIITTWLVLLQSASSIKLHNSKSLLALLVVEIELKRRIYHPFIWICNFTILCLFNLEGKLLVKAFSGLSYDVMCRFSREHSCGNCSYKHFQCPFVKSQTSGMFEIQPSSVLSLSWFLMVASLPPYGFVSPIKPSHFSEFPLSLSEIVPLKFLSKSVINGFCMIIGR